MDSLRGGPAASLEAQFAAVRDVLRAISNSPFDIDAVLGIVVDRMSRLCHADIGVVYLPASEGFFRAASLWATSDEFAEYIRTHPTPVTPGTMVGRVLLSGAVAEIEDTATDPTYTWQAGRSVGGIRSLLGVPIQKEGKIIGVVTMARTAVRRFSPEEIELVRTFADQAAIVIENVNLLLTIERQRHELASFLPSTVAKLLSSAEGERLLAGHRRQVSALFCDLRGFTAFAETAEPEEVFDVLREYQREMGLVIQEHGGTIEHYAGDGIMVFLNDPEPIDDHAGEAVAMALGMHVRFGAVSARWARAGFELGLGVGIATGYATVGRIGFEGNYGYGVVGSVPNLAARLCSVAEPGQTIISPRTHAAVEPRVSASALGPFQLKGFSRPVEAWDLMGLQTSGDEARG